MPTPDDTQFEQYLRQFQALESEPLPNVPREPRRVQRALLSWATAVATAFVAAALLVSIGLKGRHSSDRGDNRIAREQTVEEPPLTIRSANTRLAQSPSVKQAVDGIAFRSRSRPIPKGKLSALEILGQETDRL